MNCLPQEDVLVSVVGGIVEEAHYRVSGTLLNPEEIAILITPPTLFELIQQAIDTDAASLTVIYNIGYGFPQQVYVDQSDLLADDEISHYISNFHAGPVVTEPEPNPSQVLLNEAKALWQQSAIIKYQFEYSRSCVCATQENVITVVEGGIITEAHFTPSGTPLTTEQIANLFIVEDLFAIIRVMGKFCRY